MNLKQLINEVIQESEILDVMKNMDSAPYMGSRFGQDVEAKGTYVLQGRTELDGWVNGVAVLNNPLYINIDHNTQIEYKRTLANQYKAKGDALTRKLMNNGYDAIITIYPNGEYGEIVLFPNAKFMLN
jgi:hypothetical protein